MIRHFKAIILSLFAGLFFNSCSLIGNQNSIVKVKDDQITINDRPFFIKGICYHPVEKGQTTRSFGQIEKDLKLIKAAGVNTLRVYEPIASREILDQIYDAGLRVIISFGFNQGGVYDLQSETYLDYVETFKSHPAILLWELGNEYNYHPEWFGGSVDYWYTVLNESATAIKQIDTQHPVATAHGEVPSEDLVQRLDQIDLWGLNVYRWDQPGTALEEFSKVSSKPVYFSELGADSYMTIENEGYALGYNETAQADATKTILDQVLTPNTKATGAIVFSFTDGWWKAGSPETQDVGGWTPGSSGVPYDATANEEYWGIVTLDREQKEAYEVVKKAFKSFR
jgi:endo-1,4-beta-mannosidase